MSITKEHTRRRAIQSYQSKRGTQAEIAAMYGVCLRTFQRWWRQFRDQQITAPQPRGHRRAAYEGKDLYVLDKLVKKRPDATLEELRDRTDKHCSIMSVHRALERLGYRYKKSRYELVSKTDQM